MCVINKERLKPKCNESNQNHQETENSSMTKSFNCQNVETKNKESFGVPRQFFSEYSPQTLIQRTNRNVHNINNINRDIGSSRHINRENIVLISQKTC